MTLHDIINKALGVDNHRNFLYVKSKSAEYDACMILVNTGFMKYFGETANSGSSYFIVTNAGIEFSKLT